MGPQPRALATVKGMPSPIRRVSVRAVYDDNDPSLQSSVPSRSETYSGCRGFVVMLSTLERFMARLGS